jgi:hypothetical protein
MALAEYPPGAFPGPAPAGAFPTVLLSQTVCGDGGELAVPDGPASINLRVPANAFVDCAQITIYGADATLIGPLVPDGYALVTAFAVGWTPKVDPADPLSLTVSAPSINVDSVVSRTITSGLDGSAGFTEAAGTVTASVRSAFGIVVVSPTEQGVGAATGSPEVLPSTDTDGGDVPGPVGLVPLGLIVALGVAGSCWLLMVRHRASR